MSSSPRKPSRATKSSSPPARRSLWRRRAVRGSRFDPIGICGFRLQPEESGRWSKDHRPLFFTRPTRSRPNRVEIPRSSHAPAGAVSATRPVDAREDPGLLTPKSAPSRNRCCMARLRHAATGWRLRPSSSIASAQPFARGTTAGVRRRHMSAGFGASFFSTRSGIRPKWAHPRSACISHGSRNRST